MPKPIKPKLRKPPRLVKITFMATVRDGPKQEIWGQHYDGYPYLIIHRHIDGDSWKISHTLSGMRVWSYIKKAQALEILWEINHLNIPWQASKEGLESFSRRNPEKIQELKRIVKRYSQREP